jgi:MucB/RseB N-terminal domain
MNTAVTMHSNRKRYAARMSSPLGRRLVLAVVFVYAAGLGWAENADTAAPATLTSTQIVDELQRHNQERADGLKHYQALRHYTVEYRGFAAKIAARMDVQVDYDAATGKSFHIISQSGSGALCEKVLKRALDSEQEAANQKSATALTEANYRFHLLGSEEIAGRPAYILAVEPLTDNKFLFRGKIWVDADEFAVVKTETQPAKNPSFWISKVEIHSTSAKIGDFWLPGKLRSETKVRIGGTAVLTIDYGSYAVVPETVTQRAGS